MTASFLSLGRAMSSQAFPAGRRARLVVLIYHRVLAEADPVRPGEVTEQEFNWQMQLLARYFRVIPLQEAIERLEAGDLPARSACITFDDGYADNVTLALPILERHGLHATFFIATGFFHDECMWNDEVLDAIRDTPRQQLDLSSMKLSEFQVNTPAARRQATKVIIPRLKYLPFAQRASRVRQLVEICEVESSSGLMMGREGVRKLHEAGMTIGAHTCNHPILSTLSPDEAKKEISRSKDVLEDTIGAPVDLFAYPNGQPGEDYRRVERDIVESLGFSGAVSTSPGAARMLSDPYQVPRFTPWDKQPLPFFLRLLHNARRVPPRYV